MQIEHEATEAGSVQALGDSFDRRPLLCDEKHTLALADRRANQIGDRLALSGPWGPAKDEVFSTTSAGDRQTLAGVRIEDVELSRGCERVDIRGRAMSVVT